MTSGDRERRVGVEVELAGLQPEIIGECLQGEFGGRLECTTRFEYYLRDTEYGEFKVELDAGLVKRIGDWESDQETEAGEFSLEQFTVDVLGRSAEQIIPWEVVMPPIPVSDYHRIERAGIALRELGGRGTRYSPHYAFGVHLNPELPDLSLETILDYFRAYLCLYDLLNEQENVNFARRLTSYINHFDRDYVRKVVDPGYDPGMDGLIDDYISANPTRNRSLDMLPLFAFIDEERVRAELKDPRIKKRPTLHYRLPNCDLDNPDWTLRQPWERWLQVEVLAGGKKCLLEMCEAYTGELSRWSSRLDNRWLQRLRQWEGALQ